MAARRAPISPGAASTPGRSSAFGIGFAPDARGKLKAALNSLGEDKL